MNARSTLNPAPSPSVGGLRDPAMRKAVISVTLIVVALIGFIGLLTLNAIPGMGGGALTVPGYLVGVIVGFGVGHLNGRWTAWTR